MKRSLWLGLAAVALGVYATASSPMATVSGSSSFELDGDLVKTTGSMSWPLMPGDRIVARESPLVISLKDGSRLTLAANSQLRLESSSSADLVSGALQYSLTPGSSVRILRSGSPVNGRSGAVTTSSGPGAPVVAKPQFTGPVGPCAVCRLSRL